ncbi:MAG: DUF6768 family protein [Planctomycetota bacterium]|jgi:hypothetical protein
MNDEDIKRIIEDNYDESQEVTLRSYLGDFYSKRMRLVVLNVFIMYSICLVLMIFCAFKFFQTDQARYQIMYAAIFICCNAWMGFVSVFAWVMVQRPSISRKIKRLELRIAKLNQTVKGK